jgi:ATP-dependent Clp protease ATP-binding subunit ClpX
MTSADAICNFCRKSHRDVGPLVEGPASVYICGECVQLCQAIIEEEKHRRHTATGDPTTIDPHGLRAALDRCIAHQESAKAALLQAVAARELGKGRVVLLSAVPSAALFMANALAHAIDSPFAAGEASALSAPGTDNLLFHLLQAANFDLERCQRGVLFVSGLERPAAQQDVSKLWDATTATLLSDLELDLRKVLFVCGATLASFDNATCNSNGRADQKLTVTAPDRVGAHPDWIRGLAAVGRVEPFDEASLMRIVQSVDFRRFDHG